MVYAIHFSLGIHIEYYNFFFNINKETIVILYIIIIEMNNILIY